MTPERRRMHALHALRDLPAYLRNYHLSLRSMAIRTGVHHSALSRIMRGQRKPSLETALRIVDGLVR